MENEVARHVADTLKALAHPARLQIVEFLVGGEKCVGEIMEAVGEKQAITSQQLNMMKDKGVLACRREGSKVFYRIENENAIRLLDCIYNHCEKQSGSNKV
jgi:ArsR family transcriptional regulator